MEKIALIYSNDDGGYYWQNLETWETSQIFKTKEDARNAINDNTIVWDK